MVSSSWPLGRFPRPAVVAEVREARVVREARRDVAARQVVPVAHQGGAALWAPRSMTISSFLWARRVVLLRGALLALGAAVRALLPAVLNCWMPSTGPSPRIKTMRADTRGN